MKKKLPAHENNPADYGLALEGFKVYEIGSSSKEIPDYVRSDFYKVCVTDGEFMINYENQATVTSGDILFFGSPHKPYNSVVLSPVFNGYACVFTSAFINKKDNLLNPENCSLFHKDSDAIISLSKEQNDCIRDIFRSMIKEAQGEYRFKDDMVRSCIMSILHFAKKRQ
ncbi:hypothetical protein [Flavobacterium sp. WC2416]|uniref:AraC family transcriptional regulator n=1 Tax=Flavobacterium sp. WC2416 TaxID=3234141 RepID=A0AB39W7C3_9FLAO